MNIYAIIILATILFGYVLDLVVNYLNLNSLSKELPKEFEDHFDEETYAKSQEYTKVRTKFGLLTGTFDLIVLLLFWFSGGFNWLDQWVRSFEFSELITGIIFIFTLMIAKSVISLPFSI